MIRKVLKMGEKPLLQESALVDKYEFGSKWLHQVITDLVDTKQHYGGVGIAAPQIGINKQIIVIEYYQHEITRYTDIGDMPRKIIINPKLEVVGEETSTFNEGCLSLPGLRGEVIRSKKIHYTYFDQSGREHRGEDDGFFAKVLQHEYDHVMGVLYPMRMHDMSKLFYVSLD